MKLEELCSLCESNKKLSRILDLIIHESKILKQKIEIYDDSNSLFDCSYINSLIAIKNYKTNKNNGWIFRGINMHYESRMGNLYHMEIKDGKVVIICDGAYKSVTEIYILKVENMTKGLINAHLLTDSNINEFEIKREIHASISTRKVIFEKQVKYFWN